jgi:hypothetical protein
MSDRMSRIVRTAGFRYLFLLALLVYVLLSGYVLYYAGSLFMESVAQGWYRAEVSEYDYSSFVLGYLYGFPSLLGLLGGVIVLSTASRRFYKHKVLLFVPALLWVLTLIVGNFRWGLMYWEQFLFLVPIGLLCTFVLIGVIYRAEVPYLTARRPVPTEAAE